MLYTNVKIPWIPSIPWSATMHRRFGFDLKVLVRFPYQCFPFNDFLSLYSIHCCSKRPWKHCRRTQFGYRQATFSKRLADAGIRG